VWKRRWEVSHGGTEGVQQKERGAAGQFAVQHDWTKNLSKEDYVVDKFWVFLAVVKRINTV
jgi:hypothetical protein